MKVNNSDLIQIENIAKLLNKKVVYRELSGEEVMAINQVFNWVGDMIKRIREDIRQEETKSLASIPSEKKEPLPELPKPKNGRPKKKKE